jgi:hypothetical protein
MRTLFRAALLVLIACADDGGSDDSHSGRQTQASPLETEGIRTDRERAQIIFRLLCDTYALCQGKDDNCLPSLEQKWSAIVAAQPSEACLDALLDVDVCRLRDGCNEESRCQPFFAQSTAHCSGS